MRITTRISTVAAAAVAIVSVGRASWGQTATIPDRPTAPVFKGQSDDERSTEVAYDAASGTVTMKLSVQDLKGFFIPNLRRQHFAVFEDGVRQRNVTVEVEHAPITLAVLMEMGGRSQVLNHTLATDAPRFVRPLLDLLGRQDTLAVFTYDDHLHTVIDLGTPPAEWESALRDRKPSPLSEANLYDAAVAVLDRLSSVAGRKALLVITTGIDTFSHATFEAVVDKAQQSHTPVYALGLGDLVRSRIFDTTQGPLARIDWKQCAQHLQTLARASGGRAYASASAVDVPAMYDDLMEHLRVRYVVTYVSSQAVTAARPRLVQVRLVDPKTGEALRLVDASGRRVTARAIAQGKYTPTVLTTGTSG